MSITKLSPLSPDQQRYAVESGIPIAPGKKGGNIYPFLSMEVGDSFAISSTSFNEVSNVRGAIHHWNKKHAPMKFTLRLDPATRKYRCWRIA